MTHFVDDGHFDAGHLSPLSRKIVPLQEKCSGDDNPPMENRIHELIKKRLDELGISANAASVRAGLDKSYLRKLFERPEASPKLETLAKIAPALGVSLDYFTEEEGISPGTGFQEGPSVFKASTPPKQSDVSPAPATMPERGSMPADVPVMGTAAANHLRGAFQLEPSVVDYVRRPPALSNARGVYALFVEGTSMEPRFEPGELIFLHPHRPASIGDDVVVQIANGTEGVVEATIGTLVRRTADHLVIAKLNPVAEVALKRESVIAVHKVLGMNDLFGV